MMFYQMGDEECEVLPPDCLYGSVNLPVWTDVGLLTVVGNQHVSGKVCVCLQVCGSEGLRICGKLVGQHTLLI